MPDYENFSPAIVAALLARGACYVIDVRTREEFLSHRIAGAHLLPIQELNERFGEIPKSPDRTMVFVCEHGIRSRNACAAMSKAGWQRCANMSGGMAEWLDEKLPVAAGEAADSTSLRPPVRQ